MQDNTILKRFRRFKEMFVSSDIPNNLLLELIESYITVDEEDLTVPDVPALDGQLSLFDTA